MLFASGCKQEVWKRPWEPLLGGLALRSASGSVCTASPSGSAQRSRDKPRYYTLRLHTHDSLFHAAGLGRQALRWSSYSTLTMVRRILPQPGRPRKHELSNHSRSRLARHRCWCRWVAPDGAVWSCVASVADDSKAIHSGSGSRRFDGAVYECIGLR